MPYHTMLYLLSVHLLFHSLTTTRIYVDFTTNPLDCVSKWFEQGCLDREKTDSKPFNCPECRQDHFLSTPTTSAREASRSIERTVVEETSSLEEQTGAGQILTAPMIDGEDDTAAECGESPRPPHSDSITHPLPHPHPLPLPLETTPPLPTPSSSTVATQPSSSLLIHVDTDDFDIPALSFVCVGKAIAEGDQGYDFLSDAGSSPGGRSSVGRRRQASPFRTEKASVGNAEEDREDYVDVGSIYSDCGKQLEWK